MHEAGLVFDRVRVLAFIATELHKPLVRALFATSDAEKQVAQGAVRKRLGFLADRLQDDYLYGREFSAADPYLYVMLGWARAQGMSLPAPLPEYFERVHGRTSVRLALKHEGLA